MRLPDDGYEPERISPVLMATIFVSAIVILVLWLNKDSLKQSEKQNTSVSGTGQEEVQVSTGDSTLTPDDFDFWDKYPQMTPQPEINETPKPVETPQKIEEQTKIINDKGEEEWVKIDDKLSRHSYDFTNLVKQSEYMKYYKNGNVTSFVGVDISKYQEYVDFNKVKKAGIDFCMIRVGSRGYGTGQLITDPYFQDNIKRATDAGLEVGVYFFSQAVTEKEAKEEANMVLEGIKDYDIKYPVVFDMEYVENDEARVEKLSREEKTAIAKAFLETVELEGYTPMIYGKKEWLMKKIDLSQLQEYDVWLAQYEEIPDYPYDFSIWQYTNQGKVDGIVGKVDLNISFIDYSIK